MIAGIDHFVLTVRSVKATCDFYERVLGMRQPGRAEPADRAFVRLAEDQPA
ncbi:VOC family protein [Mesorhizobium atlanticum]